MVAAGEVAVPVALQAITEASLLTILGMALLAFVVGGVVGLFYRLYLGARVPYYVPVIVGLGTVGLSINSANALVVFVSGIGEDAIEPVALTNVETNTVTALIAGVAAYIGGRTGDAVTPNVRALVGAKHVSAEVNRVVRTVGRFITVTVPEDIETIDGYDPVTDETRSKLAGLELVFPRGLTIDELRDRIATRLREDYGVGYVDVEVNRDGEIAYLALGRRVAGIGPTLPPRRAAIALTANPAPKASPGDTIQLWELPAAEADEETISGEDGDRASSAETVADGRNAAVDTADPISEIAGKKAGTETVSAEGPTELPAALVAHPDRWYRPDSERYDFAVRIPDGGRRYRQTAESAAALVSELYGESRKESGGDDTSAKPKRVAQGELRATNDDVVTVTVDVNRLEFLDQSREYRLVTLPSDTKPENEFASLLRTANETMEVVSVEHGSPLEAIPVGALRPRVMAVRSDDMTLTTLPSDEYRCPAGGKLYVIGRQDQLRKMSAAADATRST